MPNRPLENRLRERFSQHPMPLDTDALWDQIEPKLPRKKRPFASWLWPIVGAGLIGTLVTLLSLAPQDSAPEIVEETTTTPFVRTINEFNKLRPRDKANYAPFLSSKKALESFPYPPGLLYLFTTSPDESPLATAQRLQTLFRSSPIASNAPANNSTEGFTDQQAAILEQFRIQEEQENARLAAIDATRAERKRKAMDKQIVAKSATYDRLNASDAIEGSRLGKVLDEREFRPLDLARFQASKKEKEKAQEARTRQENAEQEMARLATAREQRIVRERLQLATEQKAERLATIQREQQRLAAEKEAARLAAIEADRIEAEQLAVVEADWASIEEEKAEKAVRKKAELEATELARSASREKEARRMKAEEERLAEVDRKNAENEAVFAAQFESKKQADAEKEAKRVAAFDAKQATAQRKQDEKQAQLEAQVLAKQEAETAKEASRIVALEAKRSEAQRKQEEKEARRVAALEARQAEEQRRQKEITRIVEIRKQREQAKAEAKMAAIEKQREDKEHLAFSQPAAEDKRSSRPEKQEKETDAVRPASKETVAETESPAPPKEDKLGAWRAQQAKEQADREAEKVAAREARQRAINSSQQRTNEDRQREAKVRDSNRRNHAEYAKAEREARLADAQLAREAMKTRALRRKAESQAMKAEYLANREARKADRIAARNAAKSGILANRTSSKADRLAAKEARRSKALADRSTRNSSKNATKADRMAAKEARKAKAFADRNALKVNRDGRRADRMAAREARRAQALANREARKANRFARRSDRMAAREARRASRLARRDARRKARALARANRIKKPIYWTVEPGIALSMPLGSGGQNEKTLEGISLQGLVGAHRGQLSLRSGLVMSRVNSRVQSETTTVGTITQRAVVAIIQNPDGSQTEQFGNVELTQETKTTSTYYNSVSSTDIPLLIGYRLDGTKWGLTVEAGPTINLSSGGQAHLKMEDTFQQVDGNYFLGKRMGMGMLLNFGGGYKLSEKATIIANFRIQSFGKGFTDPEVANSSIKYSLVGIQLGYRIRF